MSESVIEFVASVAKVQTMADGGLRFIFDAPETAVMQAAQLMECKRFGVVLQVKCEPCIAGQEQGDGKKQYKLESRSEWQPEG